MQKILESVPNFSEGRDSKKLEKIAACFRGHQGIKLLDYSGDYDHNRSVFTIIGEPEAVVAALLDVIGLAIDLIDLNQHQGQHPYIGAVDVIPLIPIQGMDMTEADQYAKSLAEKAADKYGLPSYLYEKSASSPQRENLADIRRGQYGNLSEKMQDAAWQPDFGPSYPHPTAGCTAIGARLPLIAFNVCLNTDDLEIAKAIAKKIRFSNGGLRYCKAIGIDLKEKGLVQVSMNLTDYRGTSIYQAVEMIRMEAARYGVTLAGSELIGMVPMEALADCAAYYLGLENFDQQRILENNF